MSLLEPALLIILSVSIAVILFFLGIHDWKPLRRGTERNEDTVREDVKKEKTSLDVDKWYADTFSMITNSLFVASFIASVTATGSLRMVWGGAFIGFGWYLISFRLMLGNHISAPRRHILLMQFFRIAVIILGLYTILTGLLQLTGWRLPLLSLLLLNPKLLAH